MNGEGLVRGAITKPTALIIDKTKIPYEGLESIKSELQNLIKVGRNVESAEAIKAVNEIKSLLGEEKEEYIEPE